MSIKKYTPIIFVLIAVGLIAGGYFIIWPKYQEFKQKKQEVEFTDEEFRAKEEYLLNIENNLKELSKYEEEVSKIDSALPSDPSIAALMNYFQKESSQNGLIMKKIDVSGLFTGAEAQSKIQKMPFSITVSGSYDSFKNFVLAVYKNTRLIEIKSIEFSGLSEKTEKGLKVKDLFDFSLEVETQSYNQFYAAPQPAAGQTGGEGTLEQ
jgi:type IV pilus assembly protein PilO